MLISMENSQNRRKPVIQGWPPVSDEDRLERRSMEKEAKAIDCMAQHIKIFHEQALDEVVADFGEPCQTCPHIMDCSHNWLSVIEILLRQSAIRISMVHPEPSNKPDIYGMHPDPDKGIHWQGDMNTHPSYNREP